MRKPLLILAGAFAATIAFAQENTAADKTKTGASPKGYQVPPPAIASLLLAPPTPAVSVNRQAEWMLLSSRNSYPPVEDLAQPELRIAGLRFNPGNFALSRQNFINGFTLKNLHSNKEYPVTGLPAPLRAGNISWSPGQDRIAFTNTTNKQVDLYIIDLSTRAATRINKTPLNIITGGTYRWLDDRTLVYKVIVKPASAAPPKQLTPAGPTIQENLGKEAPSATFEDLIKTPYDEDLFAFYSTAQLVRNTGGVESPLGKPAIYTVVEPSPDKKYLLVRAALHPFSYLVPAFRFPAAIGIVTLATGETKNIINLPSGETQPRGFDNTQNAPRDYAWRNDRPASLTWCSPLDSGFMRRKMEFHDAVFELPAPFTSEPKELFRTKLRYGGATWGNDSTALVTEILRGKQTEHLLRYNPAAGTITVLLERNTTDAYNDPGSPVLTRNKFDEPVLTTTDNGAKLLLNNPVGSSPKGDLPFLAKFDLTTKHNDIVWRCPEGSFEFIAEVIDADKGVVISRRESQKETPNYYLESLDNPSASKALTAFTNPYPQLDGIIRKKINYKRADGVDLTGDLDLPKGFTPGKDAPLPVIIWAYPREFNSAADAAQVRGSQNHFTTIGWGSPVFWVTQGYAILDNAEMPIVSGDSTKKPNDDFVNQLTLNASAAIHQLASMGVGDSDRVAVGGHSYGAFMTVNLLAHTRLFRAGIARSGAYNRSLTPFGFQNEDRTYWQDPQLYYAMSPFNFADKITTPLLLTHGEMDDNSGTFPIQSERLYNAIKGHGGTVRYIVLPYEAHGYRGKENLLHLLYEEDAWLDKYVKHAPAVPAGGGGGGNRPF
jgi:dipeptidyl aminopeptidase/acylaminoacyl peptidase